ncbi:MAG TPA: VWA domain-containing protein [Blastocatellia bacterium]|nr:VWA domain-containing protein [Blastocatellia bacterium]
MSRVYCGLVPLLLIILVALSLTPSGDARAQQKSQSQEGRPQSQEVPGQTIRLGAALVNVLFSVTDKQNRYVNDLTAGDVKVLEDGKPQDIFTFKRESDLPLTMAILVDVSNSVVPVLPQLTDASARFINSVMRPNKDMAALIEFEGEATIVRDLTTNAALLRRGLAEIARNAPPQWKRRMPPPIIPGERKGGTSIFDSVIAACADLLAKQVGRKTIILFTDGYDTTSLTERTEAIEEALRAEVVVYAIGIGDSSEDGVDRKELEKLCEPTGGRAFVPKNVEGLDQAFEQLERELRQQYLVAYEPANMTTDGKFRKIEVRIATRKDIRVRHRRGYYAPGS